jgi:hypothetical protein
MGRQIPIRTAWEDELLILRKLEELSGSEVRVYRRAFGDTRESLWIEDWRRRPIEYSDYGIWPVCFDWKPKYRQIKPPCAPHVEGKWLFANSNIAPVIEFSRHLHQPGTAGRLYWSKYFAATEPLEYDVERFDRLVSALWRWVRKVGVADKSDAFRPRVLPHAFRIRSGAAPKE